MTYAHIPNGFSGYGLCGAVLRTFGHAPVCPECKRRTTEGRDG